MPRPTLTDFNPRFHAEILKQLPKTKAELPVAKRLRQRTDKRSALEDRFAAHLKTICPDGIIFEQEPFSIGTGCNYYVDFLYIRPWSGGYQHFGYEVKGPYARAAGIVKLKAAARRHQHVHFNLVSWVDGKWVFERVQP